MLVTLGLILMIWQNSGSDKLNRSQPALAKRTDIKALLGSGTFHQQTVATFKQLCKESGIKRLSNLCKTELPARLIVEGVSPPQRTEAGTAAVISACVNPAPNRHPMTTPTKSWITPHHGEDFTGIQGSQRTIP